ncbi:MAG: hypothetical protein K5886_07520 [Lachnospiraceae bacterium]|nr:hypothetical protein [Lachnospiraceae bacterium]
MSTISQIAGLNGNYNTDTGYDIKKQPEKIEEKASQISDVAAVFEKSEETESDTSKQIYSINKMSKEDRDALITQLKADNDARISQMKNLVKEMLGDQVKAFGVATDDDSIWKVFADGDLSTVSEAAKAQAAEDVSEDGYFGVKQTSQRLFDFASALAGDDADKMKEMQDAIEQGYKDATNAWGKELPEISKNTLDATNSLFDEYYKAMGVEV